MTGEPLPRGQLHLRRELRGQHVVPVVGEYERFSVRLDEPLAEEELADRQLRPGDRGLRIRLAAPRRLNLDPEVAPQHAVLDVALAAVAGAELRERLGPPAGELRCGV